ncbi:MAG TPA: SAM-dependent methyltransferase [Nannocystis sp.]
MSGSFLFCVCQFGAEPALKAELAALRPDLRLAYSRPGLLTFKAEAPVGPDVELPAVFARAFGASLGPAKDPAQVFDLLLKTCPEGQPVRLHVFERDIARPGEEPPGFRYGPAAAAVRDQLIATWPQDQHPLLPGERAEPGDWVLDVVVAPGDPWWVGCHVHGPGHAPAPGGRIAVDVPPEAPSRAYRKLEEALTWSGAPVRPGDVAVEIGSAPGGASYALLRRGVSVYGIDPAEMDPVVTGFRGPAGNRFVHLHRPMSLVQRADLPRELHWVLMDVNLAPQIALITARRLAARPRHALCGVLLTLKLDDWRAVRHLPRLLAQIRAMGMDDVKATQLPSNRMEVFVCGLTRTGLARLQPSASEAEPRRARA